MLHHHVTKRTPRRTGAQLFAGVEDVHEVRGKGIAANGRDIGKLERKCKKCAEATRGRGT